VVNSSATTKAESLPPEPLATALSDVVPLAEERPETVWRTALADWRSSLDFAEVDGVSDDRQLLSLARRVEETPARERLRAS
jgi:hypothetical protein